MQRETTPARLRQGLAPKMLKILACLFYNRFFVSMSAVFYDAMLGLAQ